MDGIIYDGVKAFSLRELSARGWTIEGANDSQTAQLYKDTAWLYSVIQKRASGVMAIPRVLLKGSAEVEEDTLPFTFDIGDMLWRSSIALDLYAKAYLLQVKNRFKPLKVRWLYPESITLKIDEVVGLEYFKRQVGAKKFVYKYDPKTDMSSDGLVWVWEPGMDEVGPGVPKADVAELPAMLLRAIDQYAGKFFSSAAIGQIYFTSSTVPGKAERKRFRSWARRVLFQGLSSAFGIEVFGDDITPHKLSSDPKDLEMTELDRDNRRDISAVYDTPEALVTGDAGSMSRATLDRITSNWITGPVMAQTNLIVDAFNHHILKPAGYELTLNAEAMTVNQEEERQRALAFSLYYSSNVPPETAAAILGIDIPEGMKIVDEKRENAAIQSGKPSMGKAEPDEEVENLDKAIERARLRRWIKNGNHLKRPFQSNILTVAEIDEEVGKAHDAPFRAVKQGSFQVGDEKIDPELRRYYVEIAVLAELARQGQIERSDFENDMKKLVLAAIILAFLLGGGSEEVEGATEALEDERRIGRESVYRLADDIYDGAFGEDEDIGRTDSEGKEKLANRLLLWVTTVAGVYALGQVHAPPSLDDAGELVDQNYIWRLGGAIDHCVDCLTLDGQVHSASEWRRASIGPQHPDLACGGWACQCGLEPTDAESMGMNF